ncbi:MAG TPA: Rieske (2Fe-2S) protein [Nitrospirales bacterium]|nr:Rieske (2Fe-2S) protein [Nitrospirales bacterium]HIA13944.1 Rieske (2Fe-2S) protein [Nitrospirales bacterium]HIB54479.1 Rieske (2Fe-2S) protein [Nitrospirales bacterium]HIC03923.1 Rieske (2Fe-2S) protein [Nitrospirales bacterium]HIN32828.1 Rieske (2Fe-2S) protein [Nitrospirales bacterium]
MSESPDAAASQPVVLADADDIQEGGRKEVVVENRKIAIFNVDGQCYAVNAICPHRGGPLIRGTLDGYRLRCPIHGWAFDIRTGDSNGRPHDLEIFPLRCENGRLVAEV